MVRYDIVWLNANHPLSDHSLQIERGGQTLL